MKYFTIEELCKSSVARRKGIDNRPSGVVEGRLRLLVEQVLDPLREAYGRPIVVTSGYRCEKLNKAVGGSATSQHVKGEAVDIRSVSDSVTENRRLHELIVELGLPFDQLINEFGYDWVHVSYSPKHRRERLRAVKRNGRTVYVKE